MSTFLQRKMFDVNVVVVYNTVMITKFLLHIIANALAILAAGRFVPNVIYNFDLLSLIKIALILALANILLKPILKMIFGPIILLTLGLFTVAINIFLIWLTVYFVPELSITGWIAYFWVMIMLSFFNFAVSTITRDKKEN
ncbi:MAG: phage holin family protein [Candidatus Azambacteria bacterium]|nr:phage holin family protein [Candidatus Azambacteria bacterium]